MHRDEKQGETRVEKNWNKANDNVCSHYRVERHNCSLWSVFFFCFIVIFCPGRVLNELGREWRGGKWILWNFRVYLSAVQAFLGFQLFSTLFGRVWRMFVLVFNFNLLHEIILQESEWRWFLMQYFGNDFYQGHLNEISKCKVYMLRWWKMYEFEIKQP